MRPDSGSHRAHLAGPARRVAVAALALCLCLCVSAAGPALADNIFPAPVTPPAKTDTPPDTIASQVHYRFSYHGAGAKMTAAGTSQWSPPACWYEPEYTAEEFAHYVDSHYVSDANAFADMAERYGKDDFNKGEAGVWWELKVPELSRAGECAALDDWAWIRPGKPPANVPAIDPETLAGLAYEQTVLPAPPVTLRPLPQNQMVNVDTQVAFTLPLDRVTVTASLDDAALGVHVAATTVAEPYALRVDAGTADAQPRTCTYRLTAQEDGNYGVNTARAGCNVTYRRPSHADGYTLTASLVWRVHWTPSAGPDGPPAAAPALPDGESAAPTTVTVRQTEAVNH